MSKMSDLFGMLVYNDLLFSGAKVYMLGRNRDKLVSAQHEVMELTGVVSVDDLPTRVCDMASMRSIRNFAQEFRKGEFRALFLLCCSLLEGVLIHSTCLLLR